MRWRRTGLTEAECRARLYGGPRTITVLRPARVETEEPPARRFRRREPKAA